VSRVVLVAENDGRDLTVVFHVVEGPRTRLASVEVTGVSESEERRLERALAPERRGNDVPFDPVRLREEQSRILSSLHGRGYPHARVESECRQGDSDAPVPCAAPELPSARRLASSQRDLSCAREMRAGRVIEECRFIVPDPAEVRSPGVGGGDVHVIHRAEAGERVSFGQLLVRGNFRTRRRTIVREMQLEPGTPYDLGALFDGQSRVRQLGLFDSVRVSPIAETDGDSETGVNHVIVQLEEASSRFIEHRITLEARAATPQPLLLVLSNEPTFRDLNIGGRARELRIFGNFDLDILEPQRVSDGEFRAGAGIRYIARRFYLTRRQSDPWEAQAQIAYDYDLLAIAPAPLTRELAFDARIREESDAVDGLFFEVGVNVSRTETLDQSDPLVADTTFDPALILSIAPRVTFDTRRDNPLNPDRGFFGQIEVELADDILGVLDSERFTKITTRASGFVPLGQGFVLGLNGRVGMAFGGILSLFRSSGRNALPLSERYALGGVTTVRGFAEGGVSSLDADVYGGDFVLNGNIELRYPFLRSISLDAAIFVDSGQLAAELSDLTFDGFRTTAGMGLRWIVADLIPIVIDYGAVLDRRPGEGFGRLHFNVGYTF
jgi:outer membrane protein assembly factor BamA